MVAWGFEDGFKYGHLSPAQFAQKAKAMGFHWAALELDDYDNYERWGPFRVECHAAGLRAGPWYTEGGNVKNTPADADFTIAECESEGDRQGILAASVPAEMRKAIITNFTPMTDGQGVPQPQLSKPLIDAGWECLTECYMGEPNGQSLNPDNMNFRACTQLGWPRSQPVFGVYNTPLSTYQPYMGRFPAYGVYLAENIL
jgi:hypothetical protein